MTTQFVICRVRELSRKINDDSMKFFLGKREKIWDCCLSQDSEKDSQEEK